MMDRNFWALVDALLVNSQIVIDRPKGSRHPKYASCIYPLDYGFLEDTVSADGAGIDLWIGSLENRTVCGLICTVDVLKCDSEIKLLVGCSDDEMNLVLNFHNDSDFMKGLLVKRD